MGKHGPCCHCGVASTPLWRNGPPDKPVLCNACGSRWRTKGSLTNYAPLHARMEPDDFVDHKASRFKVMSSRDNDANFMNRKRTHENAMNGSVASNYEDNIWKYLYDDTCNRSISGSGSAVSNSESCTQFGTTYVNQLTGPAQSIVVDRKKSATKRICIPHRKSSSIATLTEDLCTILHQQQSSGFSASSEENLLIESENSVFSAETGHGSYLISSGESRE
ncbi:unnamed protein product [Rhodiola kirilowii]